MINSHIKSRKGFMRNNQGKSWGRGAESLKIVMTALRLQCCYAPYHITAQARHKRKTMNKLALIKP